MDLKIIYEDNNVLVIDKPAGIIVFPELKPTNQNLINDGRRLLDFDNEDKKFLIDHLIEQHPDLKSVGELPRYGVIHRLDKDTSGVLLVAKSTEALIFLQNQFKTRNIEKKYIALVVGQIKQDSGKIETLIGRSPADPKKQKVYLEGLTFQNLKSKRLAITEYKVLQKFEKYTLLEVAIKTGRKHQIRCHLSYIHHPIAGDKMYGFKDSPTPKALNRQFLHASYLKIKLPSGETKEFKSELPEDLKQVLEKLK